MTGKTLNKSQRRAFARICYFAFHHLANIAVSMKTDEWFMQALTDDEKVELDKLRKMTKLLGDKWRGFAWKLEGRRASK